MKIEGRINEKNNLPTQTPQCLGKQEQTWNRSYQRLLRYIEEYGTADVPHNYITVDGYKLGMWVYRQKEIRRKRQHYATLSDVHTELLTKAGISFDTPETFTFSIPEGFVYFQSFVNAFKHPNVPHSYVSADGFQLGAWCNRMRKERLNPKRDLIFDSYESILSDMGFSWELDDKYTVLIQKAEMYYQKYRHLHPTVSEIDEDGYPIGQAISEMRRYVRGKQGYQSRTPIKTLKMKERKETVCEMLSALDPTWSEPGKSGIHKGSRDKIKTYGNLSDGDRVFATIKRGKFKGCYNGIVTVYANGIMHITTDDGRSIKTAYGNVIKYAK